MASTYVRRIDEYRRQNQDADQRGWNDQRERQPAETEDHEQSPVETQRVHAVRVLCSTPTATQRTTLVSTTAATSLRQIASPMTSPNTTSQRTGLPNPSNARVGENTPTDGDYLDIGTPLFDGQTVPVGIKSLVFGA